MKRILILFVAVILSLHVSRANGVMPDTLFSGTQPWTEDDIDKLTSSPEATKQVVSQILPKLNEQRYHWNESYTLVECPPMKEVTISSIRFLIAKIQLTLSKDNKDPAPCVMGIMFNPSTMYGYWVPESNLDQSIKSGTLAVGQWEVFPLPPRWYSLQMQ